MYYEHTALSHGATLIINYSTTLLHPDTFDAETDSQWKKEAWENMWSYCIRMLHLSWLFDLAVLKPLLLDCRKKIEIPQPQGWPFIEMCCCKSMIGPTWHRINASHTLIKAEISEELSRIAYITSHNDWLASSSWFHWGSFLWLFTLFCFVLGV